MTHPPLPLDDLEAKARAATQELDTIAAGIDTLRSLAHHRPNCNVHTRVRPGDGCDCTFGPAYAKALRAVSELRALLSK